MKSDGGFSSNTPSPCAWGSKFPTSMKTLIIKFPTHRDVEASICPIHNALLTKDLVSKIFLAQIFES